MTNPYSTPESSIATPKPVSATHQNGLLRWFATGASIVAMGIFLIIAFLLIGQALRLDAENASLPPRLQNANPAGASGSWIGGIAAVCGIIGNVIGLFLIRARRVALPLAICAISIACIVVISVVFKPT